jgi:hypothetical protein
MIEQNADVELARAPLVGPRLPPYLARPNAPPSIIETAAHGSAVPKLARSHISALFQSR